MGTGKLRTPPFRPLTYLLRIARISAKYLNATCLPGKTWGEDGYFKMVWDFTDEFNVTHSSCGVGKGVVAGLPDLSKYL